MVVDDDGQIIPADSWARPFEREVRRIVLHPRLSVAHTHSNAPLPVTFVTTYPLSSEL